MWDRRTISSEVFKEKPAQWFKIWFFIVNKVNHKDKGKFKRGEAFTTYAEIMAETNATRDQVDKFIRWGKKDRMLTTRKTTRGMYVKVLNYNVYQTPNNYKSDTPSEVKATQKRHRSDTIHKNGKNDKNVKKYSVASDAGEIAEIIKLFEPINPSISRLYGNKTQRQAVDRMIQKFGFVQLSRMVGSLEHIINQPYAPKPTTPHQLEQDLGRLKAWADQNRAKKVSKGKKILW